MYQCGNAHSSGRRFATCITTHNGVELFVYANELSIPTRPVNMSEGYKKNMHLQMVLLFNENVEQMRERVWVFFNRFEYYYR